MPGKLKWRPSSRTAERRLEQAESEMEVREAQVEIQIENAERSLEQAESELELQGAELWNPSSRRPSLRLEAAARQVAELSAQLVGDATVIALGSLRICEGAPTDAGHQHLRQRWRR